MSLVDSYNTVRNTLQSQVQGTCGIYSFYNAVRILRDMDGSLPSVPSPKKSEARPGATQSLRQYAKRELKSGQGEILSEVEMTTFVKAWGYKVATFVSGLYSAKADFIKLQTLGGHPVLVPYLADEDHTGVVPVPSAASANTGAHWSLIIGTTSKDAFVVEPNNPQVLRTWPMAGLLLANSASDTVKFAQFWAKTVHTKSEYGRQLAGGTAPKTDAIRSIKPVADKSTWSPSWTPPPDPRYMGTGEVSLYDLGGVGGSRHTNQKLDNVLIAILPP